MLAWSGSHGFRQAGPGIEVAFLHTWNRGLSGAGDRGG